MSREYSQLWQEYFMNTTGQWMRPDLTTAMITQGLKNFDKFTIMFEKMCGMEGWEGCTPDYLNAWKTAYTEFQKSANEYLSQMGWVPKNEYRELRSKYERLTEKVAEQQKEAHNKRNMFADQKRVITEQKKEISEQKKKLTAQRKESNAQKALVADQKEQMLTQEKRIADQEKEIGTQKKMLDKHAKQIAEQKQMITEQAKKIAAQEKLLMKKQKGQGVS